MFYFNTPLAITHLLDKWSNFPMHQKPPYLVDIIRVSGELYGYSVLYYNAEFNIVYLSSKRNTLKKLINTLFNLKKFKK